jgi:TolB-like protein/Tfp pilus assembly protein PilF
VNIAARIEPLAEAGGICLSRSVYDQIQNKIDLPLVPIGKPELKNIAVPVEVYRMVLPWQGDASPVTSQRGSARSKARLRSAMVVLAAAIFIGSGAGWWLYSQRTAPSMTQAPARVGAPTPVRGEGRKSIAVLPFVNMSAEAADEYLSDGMTEEIITTLSKVRGLRVAARTSSFAFKGKNEEIEKIGQQLHVDTVLEGSVSKAGNKLRITTQLINIADGYHLWSEDYDREMQDIFAIRTDVAQRVADALKVELGVETQRRIKKNPTDNLEAYELYLKGRFHTSKYTRDGLRKGADYFAQASAIDPNYALAYNGLANNYIIAADYTEPANTAMAKAKEAARRALAIDDTLAEAHAFLAVAYLWLDWDWPGSEREFKRAIELDPNSAVARKYYGAYYLTAMGNTDQAIAECERARQIDPLSLEANTLLGLSLIFARRYDQALEQLHETVEMEPNFWFAHYNLGIVYATTGKLQEAISELRTARQLEGSILEIVGTLGWAYGIAGQREEAIRVLDELSEQAQRQYVPPYDIAVVHVGLGDNDRAFAWLEKMYVERSYMVTFLRVLPQFDSLRSDPRFAALLKKVGLEQ